jgi:hypothetical protein
MEKINLLCDGIPNYNYDGVDVYNKDVADENFFFLEYLTRDSNSINRISFDELDDTISNYFFLPIHLIHYDKLSSILKDDSDFTYFFKNLFNFNVKVILYDFHEVGNPADISLFVDTLNELGLNKSNLMFINNDSRIGEYNTKYKWGIQTYKTNHLIYHMTGRLLEYDITLIEDKPGKLFLCKNKVGKPHRVSISAYLKNFISDSNYSLIHPHTHSNLELYRDTMFIDSKYSWFYPYVESILNDPPKNTIWEQNRQDFFDDSGDVFIDFAGDLCIQDYEESYINITTESVFFEDNIHISEKSLKPFAFYQLPIFMSSFGHVAELEKYYGFDVYRDFINHSYDLEIDPIKRLFMIFDEVKRLSTIKDKVIDFYKKNTDRLLSNRKIIKDIFNSNIDYSILQSIIKK